MFDSKKVIDNELLNLIPEGELKEVLKKRMKYFGLIQGTIVKVGKYLYFIYDNDPRKNLYEYINSTGKELYDGARVWAKVSGNYFEIIDFIKNSARRLHLLQEGDELLK